VLFEFVRESDHAPFRCEVRSHPRQGGFEVQFFMKGEVFIVQKFGRRDWALEWAMVGREHITKSGKQ
jgi:hypothetical protein